MNTAQKLKERGFTLIELLVVIAVLGILAAVVLVAINPQERINEANDAGVKNDVSQVATGLESCFTNNEGSYTTCTGGSGGNLVGQGYIKIWPNSNPTLTIGSGGNDALIYGALAAQTAGCSGTTPDAYWVYRSATGQSQVECLASGSTPSL